MKKPNYCAPPVAMTEEQLQAAGEMRAFLRILCFENQTILDGEIRPHLIVEALVRAMREDKKIRGLFEVACALADLPPGPISDIFLKVAMLKVEGDCDCPECTAKRLSNDQMKSTSMN